MLEVIGFNLAVSQSKAGGSVTLSKLQLLTNRSQELLQGTALVQPCPTPVARLGIKLSILLRPYRLGELL